MQCYNRRKTDVVRVGDVKIGGENPIVLQSMTNTSTTDTAESVAQIIRIVEAGGDMVRLTAQGPREAENLKNIKEDCVRMGCNVPLVADIHFNPKVAEIAALYVDKVRINPGNFVDPARTFKKFDYTDAEYEARVTVTDNGDGTMSTAVEYLDIASGTWKDAVEYFQNRYFP